MEGALICGMQHKINEMDSPMGDKGACEKRPKSRKEGPNGGWNIETIGDEEGIVIGQSPCELESTSSRCKHANTTHLKCNQFTCFEMVHQVDVMYIWVHF